MATRRPVAKALIKYNNNLEENKEEKEPIDIELTEQKSDPYNDENAIDFKWSDAKEEDEKDIALAYFIESLQKYSWSGKIFKKVTGWLFDDYILVPSEMKN